MLKLGVIGASGYAGGELLRLIAGHPKFELVDAVANTLAGQPIQSVFPNLDSLGGRFVSFDEFDVDKVDAIMLAMPHGESAAIVNHFPEDKYVVDLGADFRLEKEIDWATFYSGEHAGHWVYGLADILSNQQKISKSNRIANPGCYATAINLSMAPFINEGLIDATAITVVAASGTSGAGRKASVKLLSAENMNNISTYKSGGVHQHIPEIEQFLSSLSSETVKINFTPMLVPIPRGILAVTSAPILGDLDEIEFTEIAREYFGLNPFVKILSSAEYPQTKAVQGTNNALLQIKVDKRMNQIIVTAAIDNLVKGAAGQAIQNLNLMTDFEMSLGLLGLGIFP